MPNWVRHLIPLQRALDGRALWDASQKMLNDLTENHFLVGGFCFNELTPGLILRTKPAPERDPEWWERNCETHPLMSMVKANPQMRVLRLSDLMSMEEILASAYYEEFVKPEGWIYSVGMFFRPVKSSTLIGMLAVNRRPDQGDFTDEDMQMFHAIHPHLESAFQRVCESERHHLAKGTLSAFLRKSHDALALLSVEGRPILLNAAGREACARWTCPDANGNSLLSLSLVEIPFEIVQACQQVLAFSNRIQPPHAAYNPPQPKRISHPQLSGFSAIMEWELPLKYSLSQPVVVVRFYQQQPESTDRETPHPSFLVLSESERRVAQLAAQGFSNKEISVALGKSPATVKTQLESIYRKLGIHGRGVLHTFIK